MPILSLQLLLAITISTGYDVQVSKVKTENIQSELPKSTNYCPP